MDAVEVACNLHDLDETSSSIYFLTGNRYYFNSYFDWQDKKYNCVLMAGKKPACGILSGDFKTVRSWEDRKKKNILEKRKKLLDMI